MKILLVEDDIDLNETIKEFLEDKYKVISVFDGEEAVNKAYEEDIDLIILDVKLPKKDGFKVAKEIREFKDTPIIFLTSLNTQKDIEKGFLSGGDDYLTKPFSLKELLLRIEAILRRIYKNEIIKIDENVSFDVNNLTLIKNNEKIHLKPKLAKLLKLLLKKRGQIVSKDEIINELYSIDETPNFNSIKTFINNLRNIIGKDKIETIKNVGYRFVS
ncbi:response regulator transcription factor [Caminibacter mediatlanticus TB-2]|uniref:Response regulator transcription factor n=1 Tax=Caminibacter mediatlanticus TB-2 TaxID=391592 RepID=A0AAI9AHH0_9BACT|nr:response regulator transcription factor [Caminibacter mediatlanticus]EDM23595.1 two component transcriptional regulator, winged helix family protein [Caminibacter mediatlanticus TB-2]QCT93868.1 response regulator transcription factor [Caminibacter mediatlanticus TB-2]